MLFYMFGFLSMIVFIYLLLSWGCFLVLFLFSVRFLFLSAVGSVFVVALGFALVCGWLSVRRLFGFRLWLVGCSLRSAFGSALALGLLLRSVSHRWVWVCVCASASSIGKSFLYRIGSLFRARIFVGSGWRSV